MMAEDEIIYEGSGKPTNASNLVKLGRMFYVMDPTTHIHQYPSDVPDYVLDAFPFFTAAVFLEIFIMFLQGRNELRTFYLFNNVTAGFIQQTVNKLFFKPIMFVAYCYIYEYFRVCDLPWESLWTWYLAFLVYDFGYYWFHRFSHEVNIIWAAHQVHHSSEDYNLTTALRQSAIQSYFSGLIYLPIAFFIPPSTFLIHAQFNLLYQFWIHTEVIGKLGPLEYILNTASHHRVHHGRNPYCIDKNYGGTLIVWDRLFNTFAEEDEEVAYGLIHMNDTANPFWLQINHFVAIFQRFMRLEKWSDKIGCIFRGPGWLAECEKIGLKPEDMELPEVELPIQKRDCKYFKMENRWETVYLFVNFLVADIIFQEFFVRRLELSVPAVYACLFYVFLTITCGGYILEDRWFWSYLEASRCLWIMAADLYLTMNSLKNPLIPEIGMHVVRVINVVSLFIVCYKIYTDWTAAWKHPSTGDEKKEE